MTFCSITEKNSSKILDREDLTKNPTKKAVPIVRNQNKETDVCLYTKRITIKKDAYMYMKLFCSINGSFIRDSTSLIIINI